MNEQSICVTKQIVYLFRTKNNKVQCRDLSWQRNVRVFTSWDILPTLINDDCTLCIWDNNDVIWLQSSLKYYAIFIKIKILSFTHPTLLDVAFICVDRVRVLVGCVWYLNVSYFFGYYFEHIIRGGS